MRRLQRARNSKESVLRHSVDSDRRERAYFEIKAGIRGSNSFRRDVALAPDIVADRLSLDECAVGSNEESARCVAEQTQFQLFLERATFFDQRQFYSRGS